MANNFDKYPYPIGAPYIANSGNDELESQDAGRDVGESVFVLDGDSVTIVRVPDDLDVKGDETDA